MAIETANQRERDSSDDLLDELFTYHKPEDGDEDRYRHIRQWARAFARVILDNTPKCADQSAAIRKVREAVMTANAAVALKGKS